MSPQLPYTTGIEITDDSERVIIAGLFSTTEGSNRLIVDKGTAAKELIEQADPYTLSSLIVKLDIDTHSEISAWPEQAEHLADQIRTALSLKPEDEVHHPIVHGVLVQREIIEIIRSQNQSPSRDEILASLIHSFDNCIAAIYAGAWAYPRNKHSEALQRKVYGAVRTSRAYRLIVEYLRKNKFYNPDSALANILVGFRTQDFEFEFQGIMNMGTFPQFNSSLDELTKIKIYLIIDELLNNAAKNVSLSEDVRKIQVRVSVENQFVVIKISNNGDPIPELLQKDIFEKGVKLSDKRINGTGSGLAFIKSASRELGGSINLTETGTNGIITFEQRLPIELFQIEI